MISIFSKKRAFTLIEVILVITILSGIFGIGTLYYRAVQLRADMSAVIDRLVYDVRLVRSNALAGLNGNYHGVHLNADSYVLFQGETYVDVDAANFVVDLPATLSIVNVNLSSGGNDIVFAAPDGDASAFGSFDVSSVEGNSSRTINVNALGVVSY